MNREPQRGTITDHLADIIDILRIGSKSGTLTIKRGEGKTLEEGSITFAAGQAIEAKVNQQMGTTAFNYLSSWERCHFSFVSHAVTGKPSPSAQFTTFAPKTQTSSVNTSNARGINSTDPMQAAYQQHSFSKQNNALPRRLLRGEEALQYPENAPLPRMHRRLLLLIDGRRNVSELARLMTRDIDEVQKLLKDLERTGLIQN